MGYTPPSGAGATPAQIWSYTPRSLTDKGFWSAIITQVQGTVSIAAGATVNVDIQPSVGQTWWAEFTAFQYLQEAYGRSQAYYDFNGTTERLHALVYHLISTYAGYRFDEYLLISRVLTNALYARLKFYSSTNASTGYYGYSGFKLSEPQWSPERVEKVEVVPWKRPLTKPFPAALADLGKYAFDYYDWQIGDYIAAVMLEEDTVLAVDRETEFPVERLTAYIDAATLAASLPQFKADPVKTGWKKYFDEWNREGVTF